MGLALFAAMPVFAQQKATINVPVSYTHLTLPTTSRV